MKARILLLFLSLSFGVFNSSYAQNISNEGNDFWIPFPTHDPFQSDNGIQLANIDIFITSKANSEVTVSCGTFSTTVSVPANTVVPISIPRNAAYIDETEANVVLSNRAIHVVTTAENPNVVVYAHIYAGFRSAASLILPKEALGQKYYSMNYTQDRGGRNFLVLVAVEANTTLIINEKNGNRRTVFLPNAGDVYEYYAATAADFTGVSVEVDESLSPCKKFAAFSGTSSTTIGCNGSRDPIFQQLYALGSWGKTYGVVPFKGRRHIIRVLAQENSTTVNLYGVTVMLNKGEFYESDQQVEAGLVKADKLISVAQYSLTQDCASANGTKILNDVDMVLLNPIEFNIRNITVFSSNKEEIRVKFINVFMKADKISTFKLNGITPPIASWQQLPNNPLYAYLQQEVQEESITLSADDGFNAVACGFGDAESYAYSAGTSLAATQYLLLPNKVTNKEISSACIGQPTDFKLTVPYILTALRWTIDGVPYDDLNPIGTPVLINGETLYAYTAPITKTFFTAGKQEVKAIATLSAAAGLCSGSPDLTYTFEIDVDELPTANFSIDAGCAGLPVTFRDISLPNAAGKIINAWQWDFGDGSPIVYSEKPTHIFTTAGTYQVKLVISVENGCSDEVIQTITINPSPVVSFTASPIVCIGQPIVLQNLSTIATGASMRSYHWDFGDATFDPTDATPPVYAYNTIGKKTITLTVESNLGCVQHHTVEIMVVALPTVDFDLPDVCIKDDTTFGNLSKNDEGTDVGLTYQWFFNFPSVAATETSTAKDGRHQYTIAGNYKVKLIVTNANGCVNEIIKDFTVNGDDPTAAYTILNKNNSCSNQEFVVENNSSVTFGKITRVEWFINGVLQSTSATPQPTYNFSLPPSDRDQVVDLLMVAYSGELCFNTYRDPVPFILKASPFVQLLDLGEICINQGGRQLVEGNQLSQMSGTGAYSGVGVTQNGWFDPAVAGLGTHNITYTFNTTNGCSASATKTIVVNPAPMIDAGADFSILAGGEKRIDATASGKNLTYAWTPAIGLSDATILNPIANPEKDTQYVLTVTSADNCVKVDQVYIRVLENINTANSFTPNGDGINDEWNINYLDSYPNATVEIYDRNGQKVFYSRGYAKPFDGNYKNQPLPVATYYYIINPNNGRKRVTGSLTLIR